MDMTFKSLFQIGKAKPVNKVTPEILSMPLIMDIGMNNGRDSLFYLQKGFRVVAIEANPILAQRGREMMASYIESGQLIIEHVGLGPKNGEFSFYANLDNDHWSSFDRSWGTRNGTRFEEIRVQCIQPQTLFAKYGMPYYLKVDIEGHDLVVVRSLLDFTTRPKYISVEEGDASFFAELWAVGCREFKIVDQNQLRGIKCPEIPLEGKYVDASFNGETSGPFGDEAPGEWQPFSAAVEQYVTKVRSTMNGWMAAADSWFDIHGRTNQS